MVVVGIVVVGSVVVGKDVDGHGGNVVGGGGGGKEVGGRHIVVVDEITVLGGVVVVVQVGGGGIVSVDPGNEVGGNAEVEVAPTTVVVVTGGGGAMVMVVPQPNRARSDPTTWATDGRWPNRPCTRRNSSHTLACASGGSSWVEPAGDRRAQAAQARTMTRTARADRSLVDVRLPGRLVRMPSPPARHRDGPTLHGRLRA